ncbi:MAG: hypothetical protein PQJ61_12615 [Spirochaetales bacterium]|uniref:Uncharacterized protein n=1 Tax=Candidatus Thalassospirochaeta sargassi TaxID=3119039 RepID=A0AAJ1MNC9_9SPIO|nr:hypothetical protein [Spirochaetales bacterium]
MDKNKTKKADIVLTNAFVYTVDEERSYAEAVAVSEGKIASVCSTE